VSITGTLYVVATPIGNLGDISARAIEILGQVDLIAAEDTRHTRQLLNHLGINKPLQSSHEHNEAGKVDFFIDRLLSGERIALVSDAGTPLIADPGYPLVQQCRERGVEVVSVPGPCALIAALSISGLPTDRFAFEGFLPAKSSARRQQLEMLASESRTLVFYESTHRIVDTLTDAAEVLGERQLVLAKEITKQFETVRAGTAAEILAWLNEDSARQKGEFVLMIASAGKTDQSDAMSVSSERLLSILLEEMSVKQAAKLAAKITGGRKNELYQLALTLSQKAGG